MLGILLFLLAEARPLRCDLPFPRIGTIKSIHASSCGYPTLHADGTSISHRVRLRTALPHAIDSKRTIMSSLFFLGHRRYIAKVTKTPDIQLLRTVASPRATSNLVGHTNNMQWRYMVTR